MRGKRSARAVSLPELLSSIATDPVAASRFIAAHPELATVTLVVGASRQTATTHFID
jgi:hypothetical protein